jgi:hypothetical protein
MDAAQDADVAVVYYAGHGIQVRGTQSKPAFLNISAIAVASLIGLGHPLALAIAALAPGASVFRQARGVMLQW